jgi:hypothetical protein
MARKTAAVTPETLRVRADLQDSKAAEARLCMGGLTLEVRAGRDTPWLKISRPERGGLALRLIFSTGPYRIEGLETTAAGLSFRAQTETGEWTVEVSLKGETLLNVRSALRPAFDLLLPFWPRDLYVLDAQDDPLTTKGRVEAAQRGYNTGLCYVCVEEPAFGCVLYVQNLTALNPYFRATATKPDGVVGGEWPELGYQPPAAPNGNSPPTAPLTAGQTYVISDAYLGLRTECASNETEEARLFIDMIGDIYPHLDRPEPRFHDWTARAEQTLHDLKTAPEATIRHYGHVYLHPYTASEYPDSMVQMSVASAIDEYQTLFGKAEPYRDVLMAGMGRFFDKELRVIRRYLPNVGEDKNANAVDSWYLYHPLMNLGRLALRGDKRAKRLFIDSLDYAVKSARHFKYLWPIQYDVRDFSVITETRGDGYGQTDVAGLYAYVMLQAHQLTGNDLYFNEARAAMQAAQGMRFELVYQANLTAWGIAACIKLWRMDGDERYLAQAEVFLASFVHNCVLWDSQIDNASAYSNFFGVTCLHDAPYMAAYECFESFSAFDEVLQLAGEQLPPKVKLLLSEYRRFAFDRSWSYYPDALPKEALATTIRNGHIDRALSFPLEDLYADGQPAGQVGQEIYGCGGAFIIAARGFYGVDLPFWLFADYPYAVTRNEAGLMLALKGPTGQTASLRVFAKTHQALPDIGLSANAVDVPLKWNENTLLAQVPADATLFLDW